jgi:hypothetical protein
MMKPYASVYNARHLHRDLLSTVSRPFLFFPNYRLLIVHVRIA